jgi:predicted dinucleotide-binding enzyme
MKVGLLGSGVVGQVISERVTALDHEVMLGTRNGQKLLTNDGPA